MGEAFGAIGRRRDFCVVALLTVRNEELYIGPCIAHLVSQGIDVCVVDNDSEDRTAGIAKSFLGRGVIAVERYPYPGYFDLRGILKNEERLSYEIDADWFMHHDADEIRESPKPFGNLREALCEVDRKGFNAVNFNEFVFVPTDDAASFERRDYVKEMKYYYFFEPREHHRTNAWKKTVPVNLVNTGGHSVMFEGRLVFDTNFILRHYLALSRDHFVAKYIGRIFSPEELRDGWHGKRACLAREDIRLPAKEELFEYAGDRMWHAEAPWKRHFFDKA